MLFSTAKEVEDIVRAEGATPATVGVIDGEVRVGLSSPELDQLARCEGSLKVSRRDLPYVVSKVRHLFFYLTANHQPPSDLRILGILYAFPNLVHLLHFIQGLSGGTTVSATMIAAHQAGIPVFVTGGIGGVHRDGENSE